MQRNPNSEIFFYPSQANTFFFNTLLKCVDHVVETARLLLPFFLGSAALNISRGTIWLSDETEGPSGRPQCQEQWTHQRQMEQIHNWCRFRGVCRDERAWSQRVLNIWSRTWCYCGADKQARWPRKVWQMGNTCSAVTVESLNVIILKIGGKRGFSSLLHVLQTSQSTVVQNLFGESSGLYDINYKKNPDIFSEQLFKKGLFLATFIQKEKVKMHMTPHTPGLFTLHFDIIWSECLSRRHLSRSCLALCQLDLWLRLKQQYHRPGASTGATERQSPTAYTNTRVMPQQHTRVTDISFFI